MSELKKKHYLKFIFLLVFIISIILIISQVLSLEEVDEIPKKGTFGDYIGFDNDEDVYAEYATLSTTDYPKELATYEDYGMIRIKGNEFKNIKSGAKFIFNKGEFIGAEFVVLKESEYIFGNYKYKAPRGALIRYIDNLVRISLPQGSKINAPVRVANSPLKDYESLFAVNSKTATKGLILPNGDEVYKIEDLGDDGYAILGFDPNVKTSSKGAFYLEGRGQVGKIEIGRMEAGKTYLFFDGERHESENHPYVSIGEDKISYGYSNGDSPLIRFLEGNRYEGMDMSEFNGKKRSFISQTLKSGHVTISDRGSERLPLFESSGNFNVYVGPRLFRFGPEKDSPRLILGAENNIQGLDLTQTSGVDMRYVLKRDDGTSFNTQMFTTSDNKIYAGPNIDYSNREIYVTNDGLILSDFKNMLDYGHSGLTQKERSILRKILKDKDFIRLRGQINNVNTLKAVLKELNPDNFRITKPVYKNTDIIIGQAGVTVNNAAEFTQLTGVKLYGGGVRRLNQGQIQYLADWAMGLPPETRRAILSINILSGSNIGGRAVPGRGVEIAYYHIVPDGGRTVGGGDGNLRHEAFHMYHFSLGGRSGQFMKDWRSLGIRPNGDRSGWRYPRAGTTQGFAWIYGKYSAMEDVATYGNLINNPNYWIKPLSTQDPYHKIYRGKIAMLRKYNYITDKEYKRVFHAAGLDYSDASVDIYINDARNRR